MDVSTGGVSHDSGKLVRGGGAPRHPGCGVYQIQGVKNYFSMGGRGESEAGAGVGGAATWAKPLSAVTPAALLFMVQL